MIRILLINFILILNLFSQQSKIVEIRDANLFVTENSKLIWMADIIVPSLNDTDSLRNVVAQKAIRNVKKYILNQYFIIEESEYRVESDSAINVYLINKFPLERFYFFTSI